MIYVYLYFIASCLSFFSDVLKRKQKFLYFLFAFSAFFSLFFVLGVRDVSVGIDTAAYYRVFDQLAYDIDSYSDVRYESGYALLNIGLFKLGFEASAVIFIAALISLAGVFVFIYRNSPSISISVALMVGLGVYGFMFNGVRQAIAVAIVMLSLDALLRGRVLLYFALIVLAALFHYTALICLFCVVLVRFRYNWLSAFGIWLASCFFLIPWVASGFVSVFSYFIPEVYSAYALTELAPASPRLRVFTAQLFCAFFVFSIYKMRLFCYDKLCVGFLYVSFFGFVLSNVFFHFGYASRLAYYFQFVAIVSVPILLRYIFNRHSYWVSGFVLYVVMSFFYIRGLFLGANGIIPSM